MNTARRKSLKVKLTRKMLFVQLISLCAFFGFGVFPLVIYPALNQLGETQTLDPRTVQMIADAFVGIDGDRIEIDYTSDIVDLLAQHPTMFVYAVTPNGASAVIGTLPPAARFVIPNLAAIDTMDLRTGNGNGDTFIVRHQQSPVGSVHVMIGNGPMKGLAALLRHVAIALAISIWVVLTIASLVAIPLMVKRELRGLQDVALDAGRIDFDSRGGRLREDGVPTEILALVKAVNAALARLDQSYAGRERFLADAAHEVRTPIAILQTRLEESASFPEKQRMLLDVARLGSLAEQLLDLQRLDHDAAITDIVDMESLAQSVVGDLAPLAIGSGYDLSLVGPDAPLQIKGDERSLYRAIANLVQNAIAYGGGHGEIVVAVDRVGQVSVSDDGQGVPEAERNRIFEPFHRLHRQGGGSGLGLNLVQAIMNHHGGSVFVGESQTGGARFVLEFQPLATT